MNQGEMILTPEDAALLLRALHGYGNEDQAEWHPLRARIFACAALVPPPLNGDKVWHGMTMGVIRNGRQSTTIVRAKSQAEALRMLHTAGHSITAGHLRNYWSVTGNREELCVAKERGVYVQTPEGWIKK